MAEILSREAMYELVWSTPVSTLAGRFDMTDGALRKRCQRAGIPLPTIGYWSKLRAGKETRRPPLPPRGPAVAIEIDFHIDSYGFWRPIPNNELHTAVPPPPVFDEPIEAVRERYAALIGEVPLIRNLDAAHPAIRNRLAIDDELRKRSKKRGYVFRFDKPRFDSPFEQRRLHVLNTLAQALVRAGAKVDLRGKRLREISVTINEVTHCLALDSNAAIGKEPDDHPLHDTAPDTPLVLARIDAFHRREVQLAWGETSSLPLEAQLAEIAVALFVEAETRYRAVCEASRHWLARRKIERIEEIAERKAAAERRERERLERLQQARIDRLLGEAESFRKAEAIRAYVASAAAAASARLGDRRLREWEQWALEIADAIDPVANASFVRAVKELSGSSRAARRRRRRARREQ